VFKIGVLIYKSGIQVEKILQRSVINEP